MGICYCILCKQKYPQKTEFRMCCKCKKYICLNCYVRGYCKICLRDNYK